MTWLWILGIVVGGILLFGGTSGRLRSMKASTRQLMTVTGLLVSIAAIAILLDSILNWWSRLPVELLGIVGILIIIERTYRIVHSSRQGGATVLDLGRVPLQEMIINLLLGAALAWFAVSDILAISQLPVWSFQFVSFQILGLSLSYALFVQGLVKRKFTERGLNYGTGFSPWEQFESYDWESESAASSTLLLHKRSSRIFKLQILSVKALHIGAIEEMLRERSIVKVGGTPQRTIEDVPMNPPAGNS